MSRSHLLAGLFLVLGTADLLLLNVWLMPAAWPPPSDPITELELTKPTVPERTPEVEGTSANEHIAELVSQGMLRVELEERTEPLQVAAVASNAAKPAVKLEEPNETRSEPAGERSVDPAEAVEPRQATTAVSDSADTSMEPKEESANVASPRGDETLAGMAEAIEPQQVVAVLSDSADTEEQPEEKADSDEKSRSPVSAEAAELLPALRDSRKTGQSADFQLQIIHHSVVQFVFDGDTLDSASRDSLDQALRIYRGHPDAEIEVDGHTDNRGREDYNYRLSKRRARAVAFILEAAGIPAGQMHVRGHGPSQPLDSRNNGAARATNRRVEITIRSKLP